VIKRDYPVVFATLYIFSLMGLVMGLITDLIYTWVDPRIDFEPAGMSDERAGFQPTHEAYDAQGRPKGWLSPTNQRRWANFKANRRGYWSLWIFLILFIASAAGRVHRQ
jgi:hypothetical protein